MFNTTFSFMDFCMENFFFNTTSGIRFGVESFLENMNEIQKCIGKKVLFITDKGIIDLGLADGPIEALKRVLGKVIIFDSVEPDPSLLTLERAISLGKEAGCSGVIGFGGGSSMDVAKLSALILGSDENINSVWGVNEAQGPRLPLVLVPTTAGTGSEVTPVSIITVGENEKRGVSSPLILPDIAILDPALTLGLPKHTTAATGIDAMVHAIEAYSSVNKNNNGMSKMFAVEALKLLERSIETAVSDGNNLVARSNMLRGSMLAGIAFANSPVAAVHALAYPIGGIFKIPHGLSNALILPYVLRFNETEKKAAVSYAELYDHLWPNQEKENGIRLKSDQFIKKMINLSEKIGLEKRLRDVGIPLNSCKRMAQESMKQTRLLVNNPREITEKDALDIYQSAW